MRPDALAWLSVLAMAVVGESVIVRDLERSDVIGLSGWNGTAWDVRISPNLAPADTLRVLYHECAHCALGHVAKSRPSVDRPPVGSILERLARYAETTQEAEAEAWAEKRLAELVPIVRWFSEYLLGADSQKLPRL